MTRTLQTRLITHLHPPPHPHHHHHHHIHQSTEWSTCGALRSLTPEHCVSPGGVTVTLLCPAFSNPLPPAEPPQILPQQKRRSSRRIRKGHLMHCVPPPDRLRIGLCQCCLGGGLRFSTLLFLKLKSPDMPPSLCQSSRSRLCAKGFLIISDD